MDLLSPQREFEFEFETNEDLGNLISDQHTLVALVRGFNDQLYVQFTNSTIHTSAVRHSGSASDRLTKHPVT